MKKAAHIYSFIVAIPFICGALFCAVLIAWDPLDIRPWGKAPRLTENAYPLMVRPLLAPTLTRHSKSVILLGSSTALAIRTEQLGRMADGGKAANLAQAKQRAPDGSKLFKEAARAPDLQRLVIEISHIWLYDNEAPADTGRMLFRAYDPNWSDLPSFDKMIISAGLSGERGGYFWHPVWSKVEEGFAPRGNVELQKTQLDQIRANLKIATASEYPAQPVDMRCGKFKAIRSALADVYSVARKRGFLVDIYFTPTPYASYPLLSRNQDRLSGAYGFDLPFFAQLMGLHRCIVDQAAAQNPAQIKVHSAGANPLIIGDLRGMKDPLHISMKYKFDILLGEISARSSILTPENFDNYYDSLRAGIINSIGKELPPSAPPAILYEDKGLL